MFGTRTRRSRAMGCPGAARIFDSSTLLCAGVPSHDAVLAERFRECCGAPVGKPDAGNPQVRLTSVEGKLPAASKSRSSALPRLYLGGLSHRF